MWEIERRVKEDLSGSIPAEFSKNRVYEGKDYYFQLDPMIRLRDVHVQYPRDESLFYFSGKVRDGSEIKEKSIQIDDLEKWQDFFRTIYGSPKVVISVTKRREYKSKDGKITINFDSVDKLGAWTEVEVCVASRKDIEIAIQMVEDTFEAMGCRAKLISKTYPELLEG